MRSQCGSFGADSCDNELIKWTLTVYVQNLLYREQSDCNYGGLGHLLSSLADPQRGAE